MKEDLLGLALFLTLLYLLYAFILPTG